MFYHADSGLYLTQYRAYDPRTARWLSRDPLGEFPAQRLAAETQPTSSPSFRYAADRFASAREILVSSSALFTMAQHSGFDPYSGVTQAPTSEPLTDFRSAGRVDPAVVGGFYSTGHRAIEPRVSQTPGLGPIDEAGGQHLYAYVDNNSVNAVDIVGLDDACKNPFGNPCSDGGNWVACLGWILQHLGEWWHQSNPNGYGPAPSK
jgi:hypothetical protein